MKTWKDLLGALEPAQREPIEVRNAVLDAIESLVEPLGNGRRGLVHNRIVVRLISADPARRSLIHAILVADPGLRAAVVARLDAAGAATPADLTVEVTTDAPAGAADFEIVPSIDQTAVSGAAPAASPERIARPKAKLSVFSGNGPIRELEIAADVVNVGRVQEVRGSDHRPVRRNQLYFDEQETSVSRQHAHIRYDAESGEFRLHDDRSARGTRLFSNGVPIDVPPGRSRGEPLHSGDEIYFGKVGVKFEVESR